MIIKDRLLDAKTLKVDLIVNSLKWSKILMVNLIIMLFRLWLDKFYFIRGYELVENGLQWFIFCSYKHELLSVESLLDRDKLLEKAKDWYHNGGGKEKAAKYFQHNQEALREKRRNQYRNLSKEKNEVKREYGRNRYRKIKKKR